MADIQPKSVRVITLSASDRVHRPVNIVTSLAGDQHHAVKTHLQATAAQAALAPGSQETVQDSGGSIKGLPTIFISGYVAPN